MLLLLIVKHCPPFRHDPFWQEVSFFAVTAYTDVKLAILPNSTSSPFSPFSSLLALLLLIILASISLGEVHVHVEINFRFGPIWALLSESKTSQFFSSEMLSLQQHLQLLFLVPQSPSCAIPMPRSFTDKAASICRRKNRVFWVEVVYCQYDFYLMNMCQKTVAHNITYVAEFLSIYMRMHK